MYSSWSDDYSGDDILFPSSLLSSVNESFAILKMSSLLFANEFKIDGFYFYR